MNILQILFIIIIFSVLFSKKEGFRSYYRPIHALPYSLGKYYRQDYVPPIVLPPGYNDINYKFKIKKKFPIWGKSDYCEENPQCYPCPNWTHIGYPMCTE